MVTPTLTALTAGQLGPKHLGLPVQVQTPDGPMFGRLEAVYRPRERVCRSCKRDHHRATTARRRAAREAQK